MSFSFGFSGDDIEEDPNDAMDGVQQEQRKPSDGDTTAPQPIPARLHDLDEMLSTLPDKISYSTITLTSPLGHTARLPRRELFDVRLQLMAEDDGTNANPLSGLDDSDLKTNVYEGGYKTWECSIDLARHLLDHSPSDAKHVIELGCGSAVPSLVLFRVALQGKLGTGMRFTLTDYNADVLRCVTVPNLVLAWVAQLDDAQSQALFPESGNPLLTQEEEHADVYLTPEVIAAFKHRLVETGMSLTLLSGSWTPIPTLLDLIPSSLDLDTFIMGSETIYSPASTDAFADAITALMKRVRTGRALVAAKRVYFGVGGSVDGFRRACAERGYVAREMDFEGLGEGEEGGVRRCLVEVRMG